MNQKTYNTVTGTIFLIIAILHAVRILNSWDVNFGGSEVPMWASWITLPVAACLAYHGLRKNK